MHQAETWMRDDKRYPYPETQGRFFVLDIEYTQPHLEIWSRYFVAQAPGDVECEISDRNVLRVCRLRPTKIMRVTEA